jgi:hypothetical protein
MSYKNNYMKTGLPECASLPIETKQLIHSHIVYEKNDREGIIKHFGLKTKEELRFLDESIKITDKLMEKWGLFDPQEVACGF